MCIIIAKDKGVDLPNKKTLKHCFDDNSDGAGLMFVRPKGKLVTVDKGYMTWKAFWAALRSYKFTKNDVVVLHFRAATAGNVDPGNCHPFPVTRSVDKLRSTRLKAKMAMAHNGVCGDGEGILSDTMVFVRDVLAYRSVKNNLDSPAIKALIHRYINVTTYGSRIVVLTADGKLRYFSKWVDHKGLRYSNDRFKPAPKAKVVTRTTFHAGATTTAQPALKATPVKTGQGTSKVVSRGTISCDTCFKIHVGYRWVGDPHFRSQKTNNKVAVAMSNGAWRCNRCVKWHEEKEEVDNE